MYVHRQLSSKQLAKVPSVLGGASWLRTYTLDTPIGLQDVVARENGDYSGCKVMPVFLTEKQMETFELRGKCSLKRMAKALSQYDQEFRLAILATFRAMTLIKARKLNYPFIMEFTGGLVDAGEKARAAAIREMLEELGVRSRQVLAFCRLLAPCTSDQGTHAEWTSVYLAVCRGKMSPPARDGVYPDECKLVKMKRIPQIIKDWREAKVGYECHIPYATAMLEGAMLKHGVG